MGRGRSHLGPTRGPIRRPGCGAGFALTRAMHLPLACHRRRLPLLVGFALTLACSAPGAIEAPESDVEGSVDALISNADDPRFWPSITELVSDSAQPLSLDLCAGKEDGTWCGDAIGGARDTLVFCGRGKAWDVVHCACAGRPPIKGRNARGVTIDMHADECVRKEGSSTATRTILVSERDQKLRACQGTTRYIEFPVSTGAPGYETRQPLGMPASMQEVNDFTIADKWMLKRMTSPFAGARYDLRIPFAQNLTYETPDGRTIRSLLYLHAWTDPRTGVDCPKCGTKNDPGAPGGRTYGYSFGCVNEPLDLARKLFMWTPQGTPVRVVGGALPADGSCEVRG